MAEPLSPAAQAVQDAVREIWPADEIAAAALRTAAMRTLLTSEQYEGSTPDDYELGWNAAVAYIQNIAAELEGAA